MQAQFWRIVLSIFHVNNIGITAKTRAPLERTENPGLEATLTLPLGFTCMRFLLLKSIGIHTNRYVQGSFQVFFPISDKPYLWYIL